MTLLSSFRPGGMREAIRTGRACAQCVLDSRCSSLSLSLPLSSSKLEFCNPPKILPTAPRSQPGNPGASRAHGQNAPPKRYLAILAANFTSTSLQCHFERKFLRFSSQNHSKIDQKSIKNPSSMSIKVQLHSHNTKVDFCTTLHAKCSFLRLRRVSKSIYNRIKSIQKSIAKTITKKDIKIYRKTSP